MKKHFARAAFAYAALAMVFGVFYREFTKFSGFTVQTTLSVMHPHYFLLGMVFCLVMLIAEQLFSFMPAGKGGKILALYHVGLNVTCLGLFLRGPGAGAGHGAQPRAGRLPLGHRRHWACAAGHRHAVDAMAPVPGCGRREGPNHVSFLPTCVL